LPLVGAAKAKGVEQAATPAGRAAAAESPGAVGHSLAAAAATAGAAEEPVLTVHQAAAVCFLGS
jgi:hypothetical protein